MTVQARAEEGSPRMAIWKALLLTLPMLPFTAIMLMRVLQYKGAPPQMTVAALIIWLLLTVSFALLLITGKTHRIRSALFILLAFLLPFYFIPNMVEQFGTIMLTDEMEYSGKASFCPLTIPMVIAPAVFKGIVIFPGELVQGGAFLLLWVGASLAVGRGWCSFGCFYGGWDEFFSRLRKKPVIKRIDRKWRFLPFAILLAIVLLSAVTLSPVYCQWLCPFKTITEFETPNTLRTIVTFAIFVTLFVGLVVVLPLLTKKRIQCALFCPFGAMQSFFNKINIFEVRIDPEKCTQCKRCIRECSTLSLDDSSLVSGKALMSCTKCGQCIDSCPQNAISYHIRGTRIGVRRNTARVLYLYAAYILFSLLGGYIMTAGLWRIFQWVTTGSMILRG
jgi:ferredoxin-type protein NapH